MNAPVIEFPEALRKGNQRIPIRISNDVKHLISRMLVADPSHRISIPEILNHPWLKHEHSAFDEDHARLTRQEL